MGPPWEAPVSLLPPLTLPVWLPEKMLLLPSLSPQGLQSISGIVVLLSREVVVGINTASRQAAYDQLKMGNVSSSCYCD